MADIFQILLSGLCFGAIYALLAVSFALIYRSTRTINFAQGHLAIVGSYITLSATTTLGLPYIVAAAIGITAVAVLSMIIEVAAFRPLYRSGAVLVIVSSIALSFVLETLIQLGWGSQSVRLAPISSATFPVGGVIISAQQIFVLLGLGVCVGGLLVLLRSRIGRAMRATAERSDVALLMGIRSSTMITASYGLAGVLTGVAGVLIAPLTYLEPNSGASLGLVGVVAAIVGGLGNVTGAVIGGIIIGIINLLGAYVLGGGAVELLTFSVLAIVLLIKPEGLLGEEGTAVRG